ncbi:hypothetical protein [Pedobacter africanus]|uniref:Uncharacterized protein n=1 Tax=Pedobacter africanus TaxID=151894 RepID=A0A1W1YMY7_9SPHI|nr:hypothetical protein [Pedobacter africanus]SMC37565.1 hypothetical protein SAMN04488524_0053 [Pedobacter africanus]
MKYLAFILTIYVMALAMWPCCSNETSLSTEHEDLCQAVSSEKHADNNHESAHACSPFFHSGTYHGFVASAAVNKAPALILNDEKDSFPEHHVQPVILIPGDIWQPPKLV